MNLRFGSYFLTPDRRALSPVQDTALETLKKNSLETGSLVGASPEDGYFYLSPPPQGEQRFAQDLITAKIPFLYDPRKNLPIGSARGFFKNLP